MNSLLNVTPAFFENPNEIMDYVMLAVCALLSLATAYANTSKKVRSRLTNLICEAEAEFQPWQKSGVLKHKWVVDKLYEALPALFRPLFPKSRLEKLVGEVFDTLTEFIELQGSEMPQTQVIPGISQSAYAHSTPDSYAGYVPEDGYSVQPAGYNAAYPSMNVPGNAGVHYILPGEYHASTASDNNPLK